ncbi:MAG: 2,3-bisphosphoglycerate-independent phosphoglycerate mutase [Francisellaceae bacterium]|nr:2,3-bisphosphoglycerate-independent phosphoglycerate mutase [Francisellaceae bacterium]
MQPHPIVLLILDGWGHRLDTQYNAIAQANTPTWDTLLNTCPFTELSASGLDVGLPQGQMGNSEVGHVTMGAGRVIYQDLTRINQAIEKGDFTKNETLLKNLQTIKKNQTTLHILGLVSDGGVHSHIHHIKALIKLANQLKLSKIVVHAFLDGRDTPPKSAEIYLNDLNDCCEREGAIIGSIMGRFYAMDRDNRWERIEAAYNALTQGKASYEAESVLSALKMAYERNETDEFVSPTLIKKLKTDNNIILDNDLLIFMNFRSDRARELSHAFLDQTFSHFPRQRIQLSNFLSLTEYDKNLPSTIIFPPTPLNNMLGEYLQNQNLKQLRIAETEKYAHVTFFFNGGIEKLYEGEDRILIDSPKVATYDLVPGMSAIEITDKLCPLILDKKYDVIICNFANADMVGHTGNFKATVLAIEVLDGCLARIMNALKSVNGAALITADHGNAECMFDEKSHQAHTAHTLEQVPFVYVGPTPLSITPNKKGALADIAPTIIHLLGLKPPLEMTGHSLLE